MSSGIFSSIKKEHVVSAITEIDEKGVKPGMQYSAYDLEFNGKFYPPKYVLSLASRYATGTPLEPSEFEDEDEAEAFKILKEFGFQISTRKQHFTWVPAHYQIADWIQQYESKQDELVQMLKDIGITVFKDIDDGDREIELNEIDPFTFFCYIYKYGPVKRLALLQNLCNKLYIDPLPQDELGLPSANAQSVWLFTWKKERKNNEIRRLWNFFKSARNNTIANEQFEDLLGIQKVGKTKLTEGLFYIDPGNHLPINAQTKPYLKEVLGIDPKFETYDDYKRILESVRTKTNDPFYKISYDAWIWNTGDKLNEPVISYSNKNEGQRNYWLYAPGENADHWAEFYSQGIMGLGWNRLGDLNQYHTREEIAAKLMERDPEAGSQRNAAAACYDFKSNIKIGDIIIAKKGRSVYLGYGVVSSDYYYDKERSDYKKSRKVDWKKKGEWEADKNLAIKTLTLIDDPQEIEYLKQIFGIDRTTMAEFPGSKNIILYGPPGTGKTYSTIDKAVEIILGKSLGNHQKNKAEFDRLREEGLIEFVTFHQNYSYEDFMIGIRPDLSDSNLRFTRHEGVFYKICKKAETNYLQAGKKVENLKPFKEVFEAFLKPLAERSEEIAVLMLSGNTTFWITDINAYNLSFRKQSGGSSHTLSFETLENLYYGRKEFSGGLEYYYKPIVNQLWKIGKAAEEDVTLKKYVLIIDEINRANISKVFGELITLLEEDKRIGGANELKVKIPNSEVLFGIPPNLYIIGTMNTADKSIALVDIALRRRFEFIGKYPMYEGYEAAGLLKQINQAIYNEKKSADYLVGHAYFMNNLPIREVIQHKVIPLLMEYFSGKTEVVSRIFNATDYNVSFNTISYSWDITKRD